MEIADDRFRFEAVKAAKVFDGALKGVAGFDGFEVANVLAKENVLADGDGHGVLEMSTDGEDRRKVLRYANSQRSISPRAAQNAGASAGETYDRVVASTHDGSVVHQEMIGNVF